MSRWTHEPSAGFAADAYARVNGLGLVCVTYCVGDLNVLNAIAGAYSEKSPIVVVSGAPGRSRAREAQSSYGKICPAINKGGRAPKSPRRLNGA